MYHADDPHCKRIVLSLHWSILLIAWKHCSTIV